MANASTMPMGMPTGSAGGSAETGPSSGGGTVERRCENADCNVVKLVSMVPRKKTMQFVTEPNVMDKPMLINGFTTIFQVEGPSARLSELKNPNPQQSHQPKTIFRIVPNTHAHIVNYVVVDSDGESLRKINESDPATMRKLLESQKVSADQMLKKLMAGHGVPVSSYSNATTTTGAPPPGAIGAPPTSNVPPRPNAQPPALNKAMSNNSAYSGQPVQVPPVHLPRMHPNLKITSVAGGDKTTPSKPSAAGLPATQPTQLITPVPLSSLQAAKALKKASKAGSAGASSAPAVDVVDKPVFDKMQAEIQELRRTVALLAEAQAKSQQPAAPNVPSYQAQTQPPDGFGHSAKRMRPS